MRSKSTALSLAAASLVAAAPCDIYASGNTPCVAAHSTTRALFDAYTGALYQVVRNSDGATLDIAPLSGGVADAASQDSFCEGATCSIAIIYDQTTQGNHLTRGIKGGWTGPQSNGNDDLASAIGAPVTLNGQNAYGVFISPGTGYRNDDTTGIATGNEPEGIYGVYDATHYNDGCCFDYGNAEKQPYAGANGAMEAIYIGDNTDWGYGSGSGPWVMADMENGLFSGSNAQLNSGDSSILDTRFLHAIVKGGDDVWAIRAANATTGDLKTMWNGPRPNGYNPMQLEGSIVLGIGGDNSPHGQGTFYEGVMTSGYPTDATEDQVHQNIVAAGYATTSLVTGPSIEAGSTVTLRVTTPGFDTRYIAHSNDTVNTQVITSSSTTAAQQSGSWVVHDALNGVGQGCVSFESVDTPGSFIRGTSFHLVINPSDGSRLFSDDATFCPQAGLNGQGNSLRSWNYPTRNFRHYYDVLYIASQGGPEDFDQTYSYADDVSFVVSSGFEE